MAYVSTARCLSCSAKFTTYDCRIPPHCPKCQAARKARSEIGEGDVADQWLALLDPEAYAQEQRVAANYQRLQDDFDRVIASRGPAPYEFTDS